MVTDCSMAPRLWITRGRAGADAHCHWRRNSFSWIPRRILLRLGVVIALAELLEVTSAACQLSFVLAWRGTRSVKLRKLRALEDFDREGSIDNQVSHTFLREDLRRTSIQTSIEDLLPALPSYSRRVLADREILSPSPIQALAMPHISAGKHAVLLSETGSGKTLAFLLPALERVRETTARNRKSPAVLLIITPTRELATQIFAEAENHCQEEMALLTTAAMASWRTVLSASVIVGTPANILEAFDKEDAVDVKYLLGKVEVCILDELDELLPDRKYTGKYLARYQEKGMWPTEGLMRRLLRNNDRETLQLVAASATAFKPCRVKLMRMLRRDPLKRFPPEELPLLNQNHAVLNAAAVEAVSSFEPGWEQEFEQFEGDEMTDSDKEADSQEEQQPRYSSLPSGIKHFTWKTPLTGSHSASVAMVLEYMQPQSAMVFVCPNAGETVRSVVVDLQVAGWAGAVQLTRELFPESRPGLQGKSRLLGEHKAWNSANRLQALRQTTKNGYSAEGEPYREAPILVSAEESVRGLDLDSVEAVFILGLPKDGASYIHMAGRTGRLPHPYGSAVLVAHGREISKVSKGFRDTTGIRRWTNLGYGSPDLEELAGMQQSQPAWLRKNRRELDGAFPRQDRETRSPGEALDLGLGRPVRLLRKTVA
eukprot:TRINITY_DN106279_c0_g1_i1.p1 TRINITY_DN106279_c0_g1~~TRINITY_DN106279_c0_g1_i1.p1  ORF type:complete len:665 (-),score=105.90 TRINITY_DN106279_c0_g1_i1:71-2035(-)